ncbi:uncharacterized protein LOC129340963 [Eublepharis macularius]|uniref:Uncharacterized protein LOC129340963 n=1 Tax=Eublepharis macularius TaxID=481883 RepID=A0AA97KAB6_EUBMA|nr:uncharacterized protein LOC129340963 [Eublepharis macularius]
MKEPPLPCPERPGPRAKDHCDYLLDSIDAQLNQLQAQVHNAEIKGSSDNEMASFNGSKGISNLADLGGCPVNRNVDASSEKDLFSLREEYTWRLSHLLDLEGKPDDQSQSDSVRTEDFAAKFKKGLVDPLLKSDGEEDVFAGRILPSGLGPLECSARDWAEKVDPSQLWEDPEVVADLCSTRKQPLKKASEEELEQVSALDSKDPPSLVLQSRVRSLESLGGKISSFCKESSNDITNTARDHSARERILFYRPLGLEEKLTGLEMGVSGETAFGGTQQRRDGLEDSFEQIQDARENSISPFIIEDLSPSLQTAQGTALGMSMSDAGASPRKVGQSCQGERQHDCPRDLSDIACLCPINVPHKRCVLVSSGEVRGGFSSPGCMDPLITFDIGKRQRPAPSRLKTSTCGTNAPGDFQQPLGLGCEGRAKQNRTTIACTERHGEALERMAYGDLSAECHKPQCGLNSGCRGRYVAGHSTEKPHSPQSVSGRNVGSSDTGIKEEEQKEASELLCQSSSPRRWTPRETEDLGWKRTKREACSSCKDLKLEEEKLLQKKSEIRQADVTLHNVLQEKKHVALELGALHKTLEESYKEAKRLDLCLKQHQTKVEEARYWRWGSLALADVRWVA